MIIKDKLIGKKILFFSVQTFNLEKRIIEKLTELGAKVDYYDERPSNGTFAKGIIRLKRSVYAKKINMHYNKILESNVSNAYDYLFVNRGEVVPAFFLKKFREMQPNCEMIFYTWDSFKNHKHPTTILRYFDKCFTFDSEDAIKYKINFRPLFFLDGYKEIKSDKSRHKYDLLFLGTAHSDRYRISSEISRWCSTHNLTSFCYYFMHGRIVYLYKKMFDKTFKEFDYKKLSFTSLTTDQILNLYKVSNVILDVNHPWQKGLTMRTFEALGAGKKIITTNSEVKKYSFYNPKNILVINREEINLNKSFFDSEYEDINNDLYSRMSIEGWLNCIFMESEPDIWIRGIK